MALRLDFHCDLNNCELGESDDLVCMNCFETLQDEKNALSDRIIELENEVDELTEKLDSVSSVNQ